VAGLTDRPGTGRAHLLPFRLRWLLAVEPVLVLLIAATDPARDPVATRTGRNRVVTADDAPLRPAPTPSA
jgi:hypothetical protein